MPCPKGLCKISTGLSAILVKVTASANQTYSLRFPPSAHAFPKKHLHHQPPAFLSTNADRRVWANITTPVAIKCAVHKEEIFQWSTVSHATISRSSCWIIAGSATATCFFTASLLHLGAMGFIALVKHAGAAA